MRHSLTDGCQNLRLKQFTQFYMRNEIHPTRMVSIYLDLWVPSYANRYGNAYYNLISTFNNEIFSFLFPREMINKQTQPLFSVYVWRTTIWEGLLLFAQVLVKSPLSL